MDDTFESIIAIGLSAIIMFVVPLVMLSHRTDDVSQLSADISVSEFVNKVKTNGKITETDYNAFILSLYATGNTYNIEMVARILDENPSRSSLTGNNEEPNRYFSIYTSQIEDKLYSDDKEMKLKEGDIFSVSVKNTNLTIAQQLKNVFYRVEGENTYVIYSSESGIVTATGV